jgi:parallel beta-helix repeat protein
VGCGAAATPCRTLQYAVDRAQAGDEIRVASGVYSGTHERPIPAGYPNPPGGGVIDQVVYISKTVIIRGGYTTDFTTPDPKINLTTLDAQGAGRAMVIAGNITSTIEGLRITGGDATGMGGGWMNDGGGGVYIIHATAVFSNNVVENNSADDGGGLFLQESTATLSGNSVGYNNVKYYGGGIFLGRSPTTLIGNTIYSNTANNAMSGGGGVYVHISTVTFSGNTVYSNTAESNGGGIVLNNSLNSTIVENSILSNTASSGNGGGLWMRYCDGSVLNSNEVLANNASNNRGGGLYVDQSHATLVGNTVNSNAAWDGGGLYLAGRSVTMTANTVLSNTALMGGGVYLSYNNSTLSDNKISNNRATLEDGEGGGVFIYYSDPVLNRNIITLNDADWGGGLGLFVSSPDLVNTVVSDNTAGKHGSGLNIRHDSSPRLWHTTIARNQGGDGSGVFITHSGCSATMTNTILVDHTVGISVTLSDEVRFAGTLWYSNTIDWGGPGSIITGTHNYWGNPLFAADGHHLLPGSAAIDNGINAGVMLDIDQQARIGIPDLGADELATTLLYVYLPLVVH